MDDRSGGWKMKRYFHYWYLPLLSFYLSEVVHEAGHVLFGLFGGARLQRVVLWPWEFSRTDFSYDPGPLLTLWGGFVTGALLPLVLWVICRKWRYAHFLRFLAGFSSVFNGLYLTFGTWLRAGDCGQMLKYGTPPAIMFLCGIVLTVAGFLIWNRSGKYFTGSAGSKKPGGNEFPPGCA